MSKPLKTLKDIEKPAYSEADDGQPVDVDSYAIRQTAKEWVEYLKDIRDDKIKAKSQGVFWLAGNSYTYGFVKENVNGMILMLTHFCNLEDEDE